MCLVPTVAPRLQTASAQCRSVTVMNAKRKPRALPSPWKPGRGAPGRGERRIPPGGGSRDPEAPARLRGENRGGGSSPARGGGRARSALPRSPKGSAPAPGRPPSALDPSSGDGLRDWAAARPGVGPHLGRRVRRRAGRSSASGSASWLYCPARTRRARPHSAPGPFPWQRRGLRRPTAAKPRCVTSRGHPSLRRGARWTPPHPQRPSGPILLQHFYLKTYFSPPPIHSFS